MRSHAKNDEELVRNDTKSNIAGASTLNTSEKCSYSTRFTTSMSYFSNLKILSENLVCFDHAFNRYRRRLETCPQAETSKSGHAIFFSFFRRVRATSMTQRRVENTRVHV